MYLLNVLLWLPASEFETLHMWKYLISSSAQKCGVDQLLLCRPWLEEGMEMEWWGVRVWTAPFVEVDEAEVDDV